MAGSTDSRRTPPPAVHGGSEMKARSLEAAGGKPGHAGRSGRAPFFGPSSRTTAEDMAGGGTLVSGVLGAALLAAALLLAPGVARAADECGALSSGAASCTNQAFGSGISYTVASGAGGLALTVGGGAATEITASGASHGVALSMGVTTTGNMALTVGSAGAVEIVEDSTASHGIHLRQDGSGTATADIRSGVTIGTASAPMGTDGVRFDLFRNTTNKGGDTASLTSGAEIHAAGRGLVLFRAWDAQTNAATTLTNTGAISAGVGNAASTALGNLRPHGILLNIAPPTDAGFNGDATLTNSGPVTVSGGYDGIRMVYNTHGDAVVDNRTGGDVTATAAGGRGIALLHSTGDGAATIRNAATINAAGDSADNNGTWQGAIALRRNGGTIAGVALIENRGNVTATAASAIYVYSLHGVIRVINSGDLSGAGSLGRGIRAWTEGNGAVTVTSTGGEIASASAQGIHVRSDGAGAVRISSASDISARTGVLAEVTRASAMGETRAAEDQPLIGVTWTGTFARDATKTAADDRGRFAAATAADVLSFDQESAAGKALEGSLRYGGAAGIEAHALSWRDMVTAVAKGDDPGTIADATAQMNLLSTTHADSRRAAILARFRAALRNADLAVAAAVLTDVDSTATSVDDLDDTEIVAYLSTNDADTRSLLRNVLAQGLSDKEKAVLRAVATNTGLDTALDDADAGFDNTYKTAVRALLDRYNVGNIRVAMNEGSIDSRGDGIRAYYATPHAMNGGISVTVAEGASVTGARAGIYVANAGGDVTVSNSGTVKGGTYGIYAANAAANGAIEVTVAAGASVTGDTAGVYAANAGPGLMLARKYTPGYSEEDKDRAEELVPVMHGGGADAVPLLNQLVRVHGTVTGGTDAAVHLNGGGAVLVMEGGRVHAGTSGVAIKVNDPGPALVHVEGEVKGGEDPDGAPAPAAVYLPGGGSVIVGRNGRVQANGAENAIQGGGDAATMVALTLAADRPRPYREDVDAQVDGSLAGVAEEVRVREYREGEFTGYSTSLTVTDGTLDTRGLECRNRGADGECMPPPGDGNGSGDDGNGSGDDGNGSGDDGNGSGDGSGDDGDGSGDDGDGSGDDDGSGGGGGMTLKCEDAGGRCRLYEALPSMLLAMNAQPSYAERMSAARDGNGGWARVEASRGEWQAKKAETEKMGGGKLAYDHRRSVGRAGIDFLAGESARVGVSVHALRGKAEMGGVGEVELDGMGGGLSATWLAGGLYVDAQAAVTLYDVDVESSRHGKMPKKDVYGAGYGLGVDVGRRMSVGGMMVTPRAGVGWSKVELDDFVDMERADSPEARARVSVEEADSVKGRVGVMVETEVGSGDASGRLFGSLDVEREFSDETEVKVGGRMLKTEVRPTALRVGLGGAFAVAEDVVVRGTAGFRTSGSGTSGYGGGLELQVRF